jgi:hypothetical protein
MRKITKEDLEFKIQEINENLTFKKGAILKLQKKYGGYDARLIYPDTCRAEFYHLGFTTKRELFIMLCTTVNFLHKVNGKSVQINK